MSSATDFTQTNCIKSSLWGVTRGISVHTFIYPLEVIKIRQQCSPDSKNSIQVASAVFRQEGFGAFYKGLFPQLLRTSLKQVWCWPIIMGGPVFLQRYRIGTIQKQILTGVSIATIDATITTPLERTKILSASTGKRLNLLREAYKEGWRGFTMHWAKLSVNWVVFLTAQQYLRDRSKQPLSLFQLTKIGIQVALIVSVASAPFDVANTLKQSENLNLSSFLSRNRIFKFYRGWPLNALALVIHNVASVIVIDKLGK